MLTLLQIDGALITDLTTPNTVRREHLERIAGEIAAGMEMVADGAMMVCHGCGSFGLRAIEHHHTRDGVSTREQWWGFAEIASAAAELNAQVAAALRAVGVPILRVQPSASALGSDGLLTHLALDALRRALEFGIVPLLYADVMLDRVRGGTVLSVEQLTRYLVQHLAVDQVLAVGLTDGVCTTDGAFIPYLTPEAYSTQGATLTGPAHLADLVALVRQSPGVQVRIIDGLTSDLLSAAISGQPQPDLLASTVIRAHPPASSGS